MNGIKVNIYIDEGARPKFCQARPMLYALQPKIEAELVRLEEEGTIGSVQFVE